MFTNYTILPAAYLLVAVALLVVGVRRNRPVVFVGALAVLILAIVASMIRFAGYEIAGLVLLAFGIACVGMSGVQKSSTFISNGSLRQTGTMFIILGLLCSILI